jgi:hypothetical protein
LWPLNRQKPRGPGVFSGLSSIDIAVEDLDRTGKEIGLTKGSIKDEILVAVKRDLPKLKIESGPRVSLIYVVITVGETNTAFAASANIFLYRPVEILGDDGNKYFALGAVWKKVSLLTNNRPTLPYMSSKIHDLLSEGLTAFSAQYYTDNP